MLGWRAFFSVVLRKLCAVICTFCCGLRWETAVEMRAQVTHRSQVQWNR